MEVPQFIVWQGSEAIEAYQRGYYHVTRVSNWEKVMTQCGPTGLSQLPRGDEQGQPPPGVEVLDWPLRKLCILEFDGFHEGGCIV